MSSRYLKYTFPAVDTQAISLIQTLVAAGDLALNGSLVDSTGSEVSFITNGYSRTVSITSVNDLSLATFTVTGTQNGVVITENIAGPNNASVTGAISFDVITSITVDIAVAAVSIGSGLDGFFRLITIDPNMGGLNYSFTLANDDDTDLNQIETTIYGTHDKLEFNNLTYGENVDDNNSLFELKSTSAETNFVFPVPVAATLSSYMPLYRSLLIELAGNVNTPDTSITLIFIQI